MGEHRRHGLVIISDSTASVLRNVALIIGGATALILGGCAVAGRIPRNPEGDWLRPIEGPAQLALLALAVLGLALGRRWPAAGAIIVVLGGYGLSALAAVSYRPAVAVAISVAFLVPAVLFWLTWQRRENVTRIALLATATATLIAGSWATTSAVYDHFFGPAHPVSDTAALEDPLIDWAWAGAVSPTGFTVTTQVAVDADRVELHVAPARASADELEQRAAAEELVAAVSDDVVDGVAELTIDGLASSTDYTYRFSVDGGRASNWAGKVRTFPPEGAEEITIAVSSCARTGSNGQVFDAIRHVEPDLYVISGDIHYSNIARDDAEAFARAYDRVLNAPAQAALYRSVPIAYVWDDHDYSGNDGDASSPSRPAARSAYERAVPHYSLTNPTTINQAFTVGGVRIVLLDTRSARQPGVTLLGSEQLDWLRSELVSSSATHDLVVIVSPTPWIGDASETSDAWAGFADERAALSQFIADNDLTNLMIASGDAHMLAVDDGTNADYSMTGTASIPVLQAAALDRPGSVKGGPYSEGAYPGAGQFGLITVRRVHEPTGASSVEVELRGQRSDGSTVVAHTFRVPSPAR